MQNAAAKKNIKFSHNDLVTMAKDFKNQSKYIQTVDNVDNVIKIK